MSSVPHCQRKKGANWGLKEGLVYEGPRRRTVEWTRSEHGPRFIPTVESRGKKYSRQKNKGTTRGTTTKREAMEGMTCMGSGGGTRKRKKTEVMVYEEDKCQEVIDSGQEFRSKKRERTGFVEKGGSGRKPYSD